MALSYKNVTDQFDKDTSWKTFFGGVLKLCGTFCGFLKFWSFFGVFVNNVGSVVCVWELKLWNSWKIETPNACKNTKQLQKEKEWSLV